MIRYSTRFYRKHTSLPVGRADIPEGEDDEPEFRQIEISLESCLLYVFVFTHDSIFITHDIGCHYLFTGYHPPAESPTYLHRLRAASASKAGRQVPNPQFLVLDPQSLTTHLITSSLR
jgi:hypothetical protein